MPDTITVDLGGAKLVQGPQGPAGPVFTPSISADGVVSWTNNGGLENPDPVSVKGDTGPQGPKGDKGDKGDTGATGPMGTVFVPSIDSNGNVSWTNDGGLDNPETVNVRGPKGDTGAQGPTGSQGPEGPKGDTGPAGPTGATGAQGPKGDKGDKGDTGYLFTPSVSSDGVISWTNDGGLANPSPVSIRGPQGVKGPTGEQGPAGATGPQGPQGAQGIQGEKGDTGDTGPTGPKGPQGEQGPKGDTGDPGEDGGYYTPSVDASGNLSWTASKAGMPGVGGANIRGPQGPKGDPGEDGADGAPGETGPQGPQGPQGPKGDTGSGLEILGQYDTLEALQSGVPSPSIGDNYYVGTATPYNIYTWTEVGGTPSWVNGGPLQGAKGDPGENGGYYTPSVDASGNLTWAASAGGMPPVASANIKGAKGDKGDTGADGAPGTQGPAGADGGYYTPTVDTSGNLTWAGSKAGMPSVSGANIRGPQGEQGPAGQDGAQGPAGQDGAQGPEGEQGPKGERGPQGPAGAAATINGVNALTLNATGGLSGSQSGSTYTLDGSTFVQKTANLSGTDYTAIRARGIQLVSSAPGTLPNGCIAIVYS